MYFLLLHPPLLSAVVWRRFAAAIEAEGHTAVLPELGFQRVDSWWSQARDRAVSAAAEAGGGPDVIVAFSGAGALLPVVVHAS